MGATIGLMAGDEREAWGGWAREAGTREQCGSNKASTFLV